jgi:DNA polymerase III delta subunit
VQRCVIRCSENAAKCNAISVLCIWISDKKESDKMKTIDDDIRSGNFKQIYLLYGTEAYLKKQYKDKLKNAMAAPDDNMNFTTFEGKNINPKEVIDLAETLPFFADRRVILIEDSGFFKSSCEDLAEYLTQVAPATHFIFVEEEVDKRSKMYKTVKNNGKIVEFSAQSEELLTRWILTRLKKEGKNDQLGKIKTELGWSIRVFNKNIDRLKNFTKNERLVLFNEKVEIAKKILNDKSYESGFLTKVVSDRNVLI